MINLRDICDQGKEGQKIDGKGRLFENDKATASDAKSNIILIKSIKIGTHRGGGRKRRARLSLGQNPTVVQSDEGNQK